MTALVSVMNKHAVVIAADSAITVTTPYGHKVINSANKVFALSKYHPVGIMFCGNANFMSTPIEVIVKLYRKQLRDRCFATISEYLDDFLGFIKNNHYFCSAEMQNANMENEIENFYTLILKIAANTANEKKSLFLNEFILQLNSIVVNSCENCTSFQNFPEKDFVQSIKGHCAKIIAKHEDVFGDNAPLKRLFIKAFAKFVAHGNSNFANETQIVVVGYGDKEIFPSLRSVCLYWGFYEYFRYNSYISAGITEDNSASICRFGQTDIINTFINGINDNLKKALYDIFGNFTSQLKNLMINNVDTQYSKDIINSAIDEGKLVATLGATLDNIIRETSIAPLMSSLGILDKEDMAELVESLISITHLNRRITMSEEGVGGPIDVAIISKGDGFVWKKRKHYFKPELNQMFFDNYFRS